MNNTKFSQKMKDPIFKKHIIWTTVYLIFTLLVMTVGVTLINDQTGPAKEVLEKDKRALEQKELQTKAAKESKIKAEETLAKVKPNLKITTVQDSSGEEIKLGDSAKVHYTGKLEDGTKFDSSVDRGQPFLVENIGAAQVIPGWNAALVSMKKGAKYSVFIPAEFAYGNQAAGDKIKANSNLVFDMEIIDIDNKNNPYKQ
jgi:FKBP-type peptidyl-prolyl cis-trans isomerase